MMKIAVPLFGHRISPRFDSSPEMWIVTVNDGEVIEQEKLSLTQFSLTQRFDQLAANGVHKIICGGIDGFCLAQLERNGIDVVKDVTGEADVALSLLLKKRLRAGFCCDRGRRRRLCGWRKGPPWTSEIQ
jgi:predicted Fe-Mo cluster-binding NifX family protein